MRLDDEDRDNLPPTLRKFLVDEEGGGKFLKQKNRQGNMICVALVGVIGGRVRCGIYARRPLVCVTFEPGSPACLEARERHNVKDD